MPRKNPSVLGCLTVTALFLQTCHADLVTGAAISTNFPDPTLALAPNGIWYAFSTQSGHINIQLASSPDFEQWTLRAEYDALPVLPGWARLPPDAGVWAPDVNQRPDGTWVMYFAAVGTTHPRKHCIGAAVSPNVTGPYTPLQTTLVCDLPGGGNIDPNLFQDPITGKDYLVYKTDGNAIGHGEACSNGVDPIVPTPLHLQLLNSTDLVTPIGDPIYLFSNSALDGPNIERPCILYQDSTYFVIYNSQCYTDLTYHISYVSCNVGLDTTVTKGIAGCDWRALKQKQQTIADRTLLKTNDSISGSTLYAPGSMDVGPDQHKIVFHGDINLAWFEPNRPVTLHRDRAMYAGEIDFDGSSLRVTKLFE
ncbi:glycosyl hydrolase [Exophiala viscosa]|uniref:Glycosyl hydrolase n=1 Tax=Exophiala viscosa TaxID=2486360 RepID=A0AAN6I9S0_9EURO|nr:glycosyl hydrolase [Exophiala viscosa]